MKQRILVALAVMTAAMSAQALTGIVVDENGKAIANARVEVVGGRSSISTDAQGRFSVEGKSGEELHVVAAGFGHKVIHLEKHSDALRIVMVPSVIEQVDVIGLPLHASVIESSLPITVLSGEELRKRQAATLGDSLEREVGVHTSFHGGVASTPVIRGLSGPRVLITQNGLDVSDVSRVGPDHAVASEVSTVQQVEILRGPATLFFGSGAIGGVVNVVDQRVPIDNETRGEWLVQHDSVNSQKLASFNVNSGAGQIGLHADGFVRESDDYEVPVAPDLDSPQSGENTVANSAENSSGFTLGTSYLADDGYIGVSIGRLDREYGIPGHSHGDEVVYADLEQDRYQLLSEWHFGYPWLRTLNSRAAYTKYAHAEIENGEVGTVFTNETAEVRIDAMHTEFALWRGGLNFHIKENDFAAEGEEAFTPPSSTRTLAMAVMEERHFGDVLLQLGARIERVNIDADELSLPHLQVFGHAEGEEDHDDHDTAIATLAFAVDEVFTPVSVSFGAVWDFHPGYNIGFALSHSQRAPSAAELMSFGPHIGARTYEIGALFTWHEHGEDVEFDLTHSRLDMETANNIDLTFRKHEGDLGFIINAFYNRVDNFYYQTATGLLAESHGDHDHAEDLHRDELPIYLFTNADVELLGFEAQAIWQFNSYLKTTVFSDYVRAELVTGEYLPRQSPRRLGVTLDYDWGDLSANLDWTRYDGQDNVAPRETTTRAYNLVEAALTYHLRWFTHEIALYVKGENLGDTEARVHTSFLKDLAPRPGSNISIGIRGSF
jgi:iron complex outermembrane receptor protein